MRESVTRRECKDGGMCDDLGTWKSPVWPKLCSNRHLKNVFSGPIFCTYSIFGVTFASRGCYWGKAEAEVGADGQGRHGAGGR